MRGRIMLTMIIIGCKLILDGYISRPKIVSSFSPFVLDLRHDDKRHRAGLATNTHRREVMSVYCIAEHIITDPVKFEEYRTKVAPMIASYGGRYITKAGTHKFPESPHWKPERVVITEVPSMERLNAWYTSAEYQPLMALRKDSTDERDMVITVEGA
jgi:uncharacterized protein (DUF1330 family)